MSTLRPLCLLGIGLLALGCAEDKCKKAAPSFELDVSADAAARAGAKTLDVVVELEGTRYEKRFELGDSFSDGATSLVVDMDPATADRVNLLITVRLEKDQNELIAKGSQSVVAEPNACNHFSLALGAQSEDASVRDTGPRDLGFADATEPDGGVMDALPMDAIEPDLGIPDALQLDAEPPDAGPEDLGPADSGVFPDAEPVDTGVFPDATVPDSGVPAYPYTPSNFNPAMVGQVQPRLSFGCGVTSFDTQTLAFTNFCGGTPPTPVAWTQPAGGQAVLFAVLGLDVLPGSVLHITGDKPIIFAVFGNSSIAGRLEARADTVTPGPGAGSTSDCAALHGNAPAAGNGGGGGGSFGAVGGAGGRAGTNAGGTVGVAGGAPTLVPLRGGCPGGAGGGSAPGTAGAGGGAIQVSVSGTLSVPGEIHAGGGGGGGGHAASGGAGGGSGGGILLEGATVSAVGSVVANGGGGGGGGGGAASGLPGQNGGIGTANGGGAPSGGGSGGTGATRNNPATTGTNASFGGGGGGGLGRIRINAQTCMVTGNVSPQQTGCP
ncbi:MAG: hypothetical protein U1E65_33920 [Myxococcota bacterium]